MLNRIQDIQIKLGVTITVVVFLIIVIEMFFKIHEPEKSTQISFIYATLVGIYIIIYGIFYLAKNKLNTKTKISKWIDNSLTINFFVIGLIILYLINTESLNNLFLIVRILLTKLFFVLVGSVFVIAGLISVLILYSFKKKK